MLATVTDHGRARTGLDWAVKRLLCVATDGGPSGPGRSADQATML